MDKQTLSHYGWIVVMVLCLSVMLALATPLGHFVGDGVVSIANGFVGASTGAMDEDNISSMEDKWMDKLNSGTASNKKEYTFMDVVEYKDYRYIYYGCETQDEYMIGIAKNEYYINEGLILSDSETLDKFAQDVYGYDDWNDGLANGISIKNIQTYYDMSDDAIDYLKSDALLGPAVNSKGWYVEVMDKTKTSYAELDALDGHPVVVLNRTFMGCTNMTKAPNIPDTVYYMDYAFAECRSLTTAPVIPSSVQYMNYTFTYCSSLSGSVTINANPLQYYNIFNGTQVTEIVGSTTMKNQLLP